MKRNILLLALLVLVGGCWSKYEPVYFVSEAKVPAAAANASRGHTSLSQADELAVQQAAYGWMLEQTTPDIGKFSAVFLEADDTVVAVLRQKFPRHQPPIKTGDRLDLRSNRNPLDKDTGGAVLILGVEIPDASASGPVPVSARWYVGGDVKKAVGLTVQKSASGWTVAEVK